MQPGRTGRNEDATKREHPCKYRNFPVWTGLADCGSVAKEDQALAALWPGLSGRGKGQNRMRTRRRLIISLILGIIVLLTGAISMPADASSIQSLAQGTAAARPNLQRLMLPGGLLVKPVTGSLSPHSMPNTPRAIIDYGWVYIVNYSQDTFAITVQPNNANGRLANHLYMWTNNGYTTQKFELLFDDSNSTYIFKSLYNSKCINVPGYSTTSGTQMIVYSCSGYPSNERFYGGDGCNGFCKILGLYYDDSLAISIGNNFPGDGAWVIIYANNALNWKDQWYWY
jgi:hypothetical protein